MLINIAICVYMLNEIVSSTSPAGPHPPPPPPKQRLRDRSGISVRVHESKRSHHTNNHGKPSHAPPPPPRASRDRARRDAPPPPPRPSRDRDATPPPPRPSVQNPQSDAQTDSYRARLEDGSYVMRKRPKRGEVGFVTNMLAVTEDWPEPTWKIGEPPIIPGDHVRCLRRVRPDREIISFMHIAKAGGSAFGADLRKAKLKAPRCGFISKGLTAPPSRTVQANADNMFRIIDRYITTHNSQDK